MSTLFQAPTCPATLRWLITADLPQVEQLADDCSGLPWGPEDFQDCFRSLDTIGKVVEVDGAVIGFLVYQLDRDEREVVVRCLAVAPAWQRRGVGISMIRSLEKKLAQGYERISILVPETNLALQLLLRGAGFRAVRVLRRYFDEEDAYLMEKGAGDED